MARHSWADLEWRPRIGGAPSPVHSDRASRSSTVSPAECFDSNYFVGTASSRACIPGTVRLAARKQCGWLHGGCVFYRELCRQLSCKRCLSDPFAAVCYAAKVDDGRSRSYCFAACCSLC